MANKDLFKQAIAEAKSVREAAIANAKEALEESLTPHLKDMLAAKLQEMDNEHIEEEVVNEAEVEETIDEAPAKEKEMEEAMKDDDMDEGMKDDDMDEAHHDDDMEEAHGDEDEAMEEAEDDSEESEDEAEGDEEAEEAEEEDVEVKDMEVEDLKDLIRDIIAQEMGDGGEEEIDDPDMDAGAEMEPAMDGMDAGAEEEEIDLDELLAELEAATNEEVTEEEVTEEVEEEIVAEEKVKEEDNSELNEALETIQNLQSQLSEVNLLNAKLMYVNKVFKANNLSESQKVNIIAAFDKAETVKEVKLVFETVSDSVVNKKATKVNESKLGMASKPTGTTATKPEVISEVSDAVKRMQKLAGII